QPRPAVDLGAARAALAGLAVPADGQVVGLGRLDAMEHVEDDHPGIDGHPVLAEGAARGVAAEDVQRGLRRHYLASSRSFFSSSGIAGSDSWVTVRRPFDWRITTLTRPKCDSGLG